MERHALAVLLVAALAGCAAPSAEDAPTPADARVELASPACGISLEHPATWRVIGGDELGMFILLPPEGSASREKAMARSVAAGEVERTRERLRDGDPAPYVGFQNATLLTSRDAVDDGRDALLFVFDGDTTGLRHRVSVLVVEVGTRSVSLTSSHPASVPASAELMALRASFRALAPDGGACAHLSR